MPGDLPPLPDSEPQPNDSVPAEAASPPGSPPPREPVPSEALWAAIPMARPVSIDSFPQPRVPAGTLASSAAHLTRVRAVVQIVGVLLAGIVGGFVTGLLGAFIPLSDQRWLDLIAMAGAGASGVAAAFLMVRSAGQRPAAIGWRVNQVGADIGLGIGMAFAVYVIMIMAATAWVAINPEALSERTQAQKAIEQAIPRTSIPSLVLMMSFVALWEEVVFRGFLLTRLYALFRRWWLAVPVGAVLFSLGHGWQGHIATVVIGGVGLFLGVLFVWRRSLLPPIAFHFTFNLIGMLALRSQETLAQ